MLNKILLEVDKFMSEMHLRQLYSVSGPFTKNKERSQIFKETGDSRYIDRNELGKAFFQHDMTYEDIKNLSRRTASGNVWCDNAFNIAGNPKYVRYQRGLASMVTNFW